VHEGASAALGVARFDWTCDPHLFGSASVSISGGISVVADATLYYRHDLLRSLAAKGATPTDESPTALILAAYRAWGDDLADHLEGDFAGIIYDESRRCAVLIRDHGGRRPLYYALDGDRLLVASAARALYETAETGRLDVATIAATSLSFLGGAGESPFIGIERVHPGSTVRWRSGRALTVARWAPPRFRVRGPARLADSAPVLRQLLTDSVAERCGDNTAAVWMSGGADSTAVFGAAHVAAATGRLRTRPRPVTVSYPVGDTAREDEFVEAISQQLQAPVTWLQSESIDLLENLAADAVWRDDPAVHTFEHVNSLLARTSASFGARIALDGYGGDSLFHVSDIFLADLFVLGKWRQLHARLRKLGMLSPRGFLRMVGLPLLPNPVRAILDEIRGERGLAGWLPPWIQDRWLASNDLERRRIPSPTRHALESPGAYESRWYLESPFMPRAVANVATIALRNGVDLRSPIYDRRVIEFAASRPLAERASNEASKVVLSASMKGVLPESVLLPRPIKTGVPSHYVARQMARGLVPAFQEVLLGGSPRLAELGVVDVKRLSYALLEYDRTKRRDHGVVLFSTLQTELWLRSLNRIAT
jgi:asparagine synthase (glutamine-hydrolysing)